MDTVLLNISAGVGPEECARAAALTLAALQKEIADKQGGIAVRVIETEPSREKGNVRSALVALEGDGAKLAARPWIGVIQWIWRSAYRPHYKRKNWFVQVSQVLELERVRDFSFSDVRFETARAGGPGGQHVNKTESSVRAIHIPTGKSVVCREERSQFLNKKTALLKLASLFAREATDRTEQARSDLRRTHWELERGNPIRIYSGETLQLLADHANIPANIQEETHHG